MTKPIKLMALDEADLTVISAMTQDALVKVSEVEYLNSANKLTLSLNRYAWEIPGARRWLFPRKERRLSVLHFDRVNKVRGQNIDPGKADTVLSLLSIRFDESGDEHDPSGTLVFTFSGGAVLAAEVECIEAQLTDLGASWSAVRRPRHAGDGDI